MYVKMGKNHYSSAVDYYAKAINKKVLSDSQTSMLHSSRANVNLLLGNYRRALTDAQEAIKLCPFDVEAVYQASKACLSLNLLSAAKFYINSALEKCPDHEDAKKLAEQIKLVKLEKDKQRKVIGDEDEVVIVEEYEMKSKSMKFEDDDDDDCVVLDCDPEKVVENESGGDGDNDDDVVVVGQKGQIACRDYPHPRHDCAKFPFISTPHKTHCDLCHCYVCDSPAPCAFWVKGIFYHCHATKNERWNTLRHNLRLQNKEKLVETGEGMSRLKL